MKTCADLSVEYEESARLIAGRISELQEHLGNIYIGSAEYYNFIRRIDRLTILWEETVCRAWYLKHYYGGKRHGATL